MPDDAGFIDAGPTGTGPVDRGPTDAGAMDTGLADTGLMDADPAGTGPSDAGPVASPTTRSLAVAPIGAANASLRAACCWGLLTIALLPAAVLYASGARPSTALLLQCAVVLHTGGALAWVLAGARVRLMAFGFWLFGYIWLGLAPLAMLASGRYPLGYVVGQGTAATACAVVETGLVAYTAGALAARGRRGRPSAVLGPLLARRVAPVRVLLLGIAALLLAAVLIPGQDGGLGAYFTSRQALNAPTAAAGTQGSAARALASWAVSAPAFWALLTLLHLPRARKGRSDGLLRAARWALLPPLAALNVVVNNPVSQPRFWAGTVLLALLFSLDSLRRPRGFRVAAAATLTAVLVVFPYGDYFRDNTREPTHLTSLAQQFTDNGDYDAYQQLQTAVELRERDGGTPEAVLGPPLFFVPRAVWPGKPEDTGIELARYAGYRFDNLSAPLWAESYLWAGFPAVALLFCLYGAAGRRVDDVCAGLAARPRPSTSDTPEQDATDAPDMPEAARSRGTLAVLLVPGLAFFQLILLRGSLMASMGPLALLILIPLCASARPGYRVLGEAGGRAAHVARTSGLPTTTS